MAKWLRSLIFSDLNRSSSHHCGFEVWVLPGCKLQRFSRDMAHNISDCWCKACVVASWCSAVNWPTEWEQHRLQGNVTQVFYFTTIPAATRGRLTYRMRAAQTSRKCFISQQYLQQPEVGWPTEWEQHRLQGNVTQVFYFRTVPAAISGRLTYRIRAAQGNVTRVFYFTTIPAVTRQV